MVIFWLCGLVGFVILAFSVRQNLRHGFQRSRPSISLLEEGMLWIDSLKASLEEEDAPQSLRTRDAPANRNEVAVASANLINLQRAVSEGAIAETSSEPVTSTTGNHSALPVSIRPDICVNVETE